MSAFIVGVTHMHWPPRALRKGPDFRVQPVLNGRSIALCRMAVTVPKLGVRTSVYISI